MEIKKYKVIFYQKKEKIMKGKSMKDVGNAAERYVDRLNQAEDGSIRLYSVQEIDNEIPLQV